MRTCRLIVDSPADGAWNMAIDDVLLTAASERGEATLRFYGWKEPTLSLGYFQKYESREAHEPSRDCPVVRRASGGGAILHDRELTYSLALPHAYWQDVGRVRLYSVVHQTICDCFAELGIHNARILGDDAALEQVEADAQTSFLCFERREAFDVVLPFPDHHRHTTKIVGSAQRGLYGAVLQHGSILLARSPFAPTLPGIQEASDFELSPHQLIEAWLPRLAAAFDADWSPDPEFASYAETAIRAVSDKFASDAWLRRR